MKSFNEHILHMLISLFIVGSLSACGTLRVEWQEGATTESIPETSSLTQSTEAGEGTREVLEQVTQEPSVPTHTATLDPSPTNTPRPTFTPRPTATPRPTLPPIDFEALAPITVQNADQLARIARFELDDADALAWAKDSRSFFVVRGDRIHHLDLQERYELAAWSIIPQEAEIKFCSAQSLVMLYFDELQRDYGYEIYVWDLTTGRQLHTFNDAVFRISTTGRPRFSPDCSLLAVGLNHGNNPSVFRVFDLQTGDGIYSTTDSDPMIWGLTVSAQSRRLVGRTNNGLFLWGFDQREPLFEIEGEFGIGRIGFDPAGVLLALPHSVEEPPFLTTIYDLQRRAPIGTHDGWFEGFSAQGSWLMTADWERFMLWDVSSGECLREFPGVASMTLSPDQSMLLVTYGPGSFEDIVEVWGVASH